MKKSETFYVHNEPVKPPKQWKGKIIALVSIVLLFGGGYLLLLTLLPRAHSLPVSSAIDLNTADDEGDTRNRIQIERIKVEVPYFGENTPASLEKGAWWRYPERGDPEKGGNFIISAHRFNLGYTPTGTRAKSPFYNLNQMQQGDKIKVYFNNKWYEYEVTKNYSVGRNAVEIEAATSEPRLTLYTCSLKGEADGRVVIEAKPLFQTEEPTNTPEQSQEPADGSPLL